VYEGENKFVVKANGIEIANFKYLVEDWNALAHLQKLNIEKVDYYIN